MSDDATQYAQAVANDDIDACRFVRLACERHLRDLDRVENDDEFEYIFRADFAERFFKFCTYLKHYKGDYKGKSFELLPWQKFVFGMIYGWVDAKNNWRFKQAYIEVPRKNGKTTMAAAGAAFDAAFVDTTGAEVYCVATKEDQAKLLFNDCNAYINQSEELQDVFHVLGGKSTIFVEDTARTSFIRPLGADSNRHDGLNPLAVYTDELHAWKTRSLWDVMEDAFGARSNYHMISITTSGFNQSGICYEERAHLIEILEQTIDFETKFGIIYTVDEEDQNDWDEERVWRIANPTLDQGKSLAYMREQSIKVQQVPSKLNTFLNKQLNIWTDAEQSWISIDDWRDCAAAFSESDLVGKTCFGGIDLARVNDLSSFALYFPEQDGLARARILVTSFLPSEELRTKIETDRVPYDLWSEQGHLVVTDGKTTDWTFIRETIVRANGVFDLRSVGYDKHFAGELISSLEKADVELTQIGMNPMAISEPTSEFERLVVSREIEQNENPLLLWNIQNGVISEDANGNIRVDKQKSFKKIDALVASIVAVATAMKSPDEKKESIYESRGILSF